MTRANNRGVTLIELIVGVAITAIVSAITLGLFRAGIYAYNYSLRQAFVLSSARKAIHAKGNSLGLLWAVQDAQAAVNLSSSTLTIKPSSGSALKYWIGNETLFQEQLSFTQPQALGISNLQINYYGLDSQGKITESASASNAILVTTWLTLESRRKRTYLFFSGSSMRNHQ